MPVGSSGPCGSPAAAPPSQYFDTAAARAFLADGEARGALGDAAPDARRASAPHVFAATLPLRALAAQLLWSWIVTGAVYALARGRQNGTETSTLSSVFWSTRLSIGSNTVFGVGWAVFLLLAFFLRQATARHLEASAALYAVPLHLRTLLRGLLQNFPEGMWHPGDRDRVAAHLVAYPVALKMALREELADESQLAMLLQPSDLAAALAAELPHLHCARVVRAYIDAAQSDGGRKGSLSRPLSCGVITRAWLFMVADRLDACADVLISLKRFRPAVGFVTHLHVLLFIWLFFLPLDVVTVAGWFTPVITVIITYGVGMIYNIAVALNKPFGFDLHNIPLTALVANSALSVLSLFMDENLHLEDLLEPTQSASTWLHGNDSYSRGTPNSSSDGGTDSSAADEDSADGDPMAKKHSEVNELIGYLRSKSVYIPITVYVIWLAFVTFFTRHSAARSGAPFVFDPTVCRWWCPYIPVDARIVSYLSLVTFVTFAYWLSIAYERYEAGLRTWISGISVLTTNLAVTLTTYVPNGYWHDGDRERILAHLAALPIAAKQFLRNSRDVSELQGFLAPADLEQLERSPDLPQRIFHVLYAYLSSMDCSEEKPYIPSGKYPSIAGQLHALLSISALETAVTDCNAIRRVPIPQTFTLHVALLLATWLAAVPLSLVSFNGFLTIALVLPFASVFIILFKLAREFVNPFGYDNHDIDLDKICLDVRMSIIDTFKCAELGWKHLLLQDEHAEDQTGLYERSKFLPRAPTAEEHGQAYKEYDRVQNPTLLDNMKTFWRPLILISSRRHIIALLWAVSSVALSRGLSFLWEREKREACDYWCSPFDIQVSTTGNIGIALFLLLAFRASEALDRYRGAVHLLRDLECKLRAVAMEFCQSIPDGAFHLGDKERFVAHVVEIALCFRDQLLDRETPRDAREGLLSSEDYRSMRRTHDPLKYLFSVVEAYVLVLDCSWEEPAVLGNRTSKGSMTTVAMLTRIKHMRRFTAWAFGIKMMADVITFTKQRRSFMVLWLFTVPFSMTASSGWLSILWVFLISYAVLGLDKIAVDLMDPFGDDRMDVDVDLYCNRAASSVVEGVLSMGWSSIPLTISPAEPAGQAYIGMRLDGTIVKRESILPAFAEFEATMSNTEEEVRIPLGVTTDVMLRPTLLSHLPRSAPWWALLSITIYSLFAVFLSYIARRHGVSDARWWKSTLSVGQNVAQYLSVAAFLMLGTYFGKTFAIYKSAMSEWVEGVQESCTSLAALWQIVAPEGSFHDGDVDRVFAHIAALPIALRQDLREKRDIRDLRAILKPGDLAEMHCASKMSNRCVDVVHSYFVRGNNASESLENGRLVPGMRHVAVIMSLMDLENSLCSLFVLKHGPISDAFVGLTMLLLATWFIILPLIIAEQSGWLTMVWMPIITYAVLGVFRMAAELEDPFGYDLNDINLDMAADKIVREVLSIRSSYGEGFDVLIRETEGTEELWKDNRMVTEVIPSITGDEESSLFVSEDKDQDLSNISWGKLCRLVVHAVSWSKLVAVALWSGGCVVLAYLVHRHWQLPAQVQKRCSPWWCSRIALPAAVSGYVGFALFSLFGLLMNDSHAGYTRALRLWREDLITSSRAICSVFFNNTPPGTFHTGDRERVAGHLAALGYVCKGSLRGEDISREIRMVVSEEDAVSIERAESPADYCVDVVRAYLCAVDGQLRSRSNGIPFSVTYSMHLNLRKLRLVFHRCQSIRQQRLPFGCLMHARVFQLLWISLLPLSLVEGTGWLAILWTIVVAYALSGIETWAVELTDPFGDDLADIPLRRLCHELHASVAHSFEAYKDFDKSLVLQ